MRPVWDNYIDAVGKTMTIYKLSSIAYDDLNQIDFKNSTFTKTTAKMFVGARKSPRSFESSQLRNESGFIGKEEYLAIYVKSDVDLSIRNGFDADFIRWEGRLFRVVREDKDFMMKDRAMLAKFFIQEMPPNMIPVWPINIFA